MHKNYFKNYINKMSLTKIKLYCLLLLSVNILSKNQYYLSNPTYSDDGSSFSGILSFKGDFSQSDYHYDWTKTSDLLIPIKQLNIQISLECSEYLHIYITDALEERWEHPFSISEEYKEKKKECSGQKTQKNLTEFGLYISENYDEPFYISLKHPTTGELIFTTENTDFLYTDIFIGFGGYFTSNDIYGFGERYHELKLGDGKFTIWPNDSCGIHRDTGEGGYNAMGSHPLGFHKTSKKTFVGLLFNNINAQDVLIKSDKEMNSENNVLLEHRTIGGVIDYYITINDTPDKALVSLHDIIGHPTLPPFWALGFHQCKWGYSKTEDIRQVYENYISNELPIDTFWGDIDVLQDYRIFTLNQENFHDLPSLIEEIHDNHYKFVPIVDIGFPQNENDEFYVMGKETNAFIKSSYTNEDLISNVWPGKAVFPDFFCKEAEDLWSYAMQKYYDVVKYDGIWLDMNEPAMTGVDDIKRGELLPEGFSFDKEKNPFEDIPYVPGFRDEHPTISGRSLSDNCYSKLITENKFLYGYNFKPLMSLIQARITTEQIINIQKKRPFILSRSTSLSYGKYGFHWLGDNYSNYADMKNGINGIFQFQIYGIPITGDDICGFIDDSWDELCARWMSLGAFFPFSRNHNFIGRRPQEPFAFGPDSKTLLSSKNALKMKYSLLRYYYTQLFRVSLGNKGAFFKPAFFEYFSDEETYNNMDDSVMLGDSLILYPNFHDETDDTSAYLPKGDWYTYPQGEMVKSLNEDGGNIVLSGEFGKINLFMKGGHIIPFQNTFDEFIPNTYKLHEKPTELIIMPDSENHFAEGELIFDDDSYDTLKEKNYYHIKIKFIYESLFFDMDQKMKSSYENKDIYISKLKFLNMKYICEEEEKYDIISIICKNGKKYKSVLIYKPNNTIEVNISNLNLKVYEISNIQFSRIKYKSKSYTN